MKRFLILATLLAALAVPQAADAHRYDRWGASTLGDFNYAVAANCGAWNWICVFRKTGNEIALRDCGEHAWCTRLGGSNWTHIEEHIFGNRHYCDTVAKSVHGSLQAGHYDSCGPARS